jgi:uncharacterized membrane protein
MTTASGDAIVDRYLEQLDDELRAVPPPRRREVVTEISGHIAEAREELDAETDADVLNILDRVGDPTEIAVDARERFGVRERQSNWREVAALILLPFGALIIPVAGWFIGVFFLWISDAWTRGEKLIGTLIIPGGLALPFTLFAFVGMSSGQTCTLQAGGHWRCTGTGSTSSSAGIVLLVVLLVAPLCADLYLGLRLRRR